MTGDKPSRAQLQRQVERLTIENQLLRERIDRDRIVYVEPAHELACLRIMQKQMQQVTAGEFVE